MLAMGLESRSTVLPLANLCDISFSVGDLPGQSALRLLIKEQLPVDARNRACASPSYCMALAAVAASSTDLRLTTGPLDALLSSRLYTPFLTR